MFGPLFSLELLLGGRRGRLQRFRRIYADWLIIQFFFYFLCVLAGFFALPPSTKAIHVFSPSLNLFVEILVAQHFFLLFLTIPPFVAGAIADEKASGTLQNLLAADLSVGEIVVGKLFGRLAQVGVLALTGLPMIVFMSGIGAITLDTLLALVAVTVVFTWAFGAASILASVWSTQTRAAVLRLYTWCTIGALCAWGIQHWLLLNQGFVVLFLFSLAVGIRASGAISGERERHTWRLLLLTPLDNRDLILGKLDGILWSVYPYMFVYGIASFLMMGFVGESARHGITGQLAFLWAGTYFAGATGLLCSVQSSNSWRSLLYTLAGSYGYALLIFVLTVVPFDFMWDDFNRPSRFATGRRSDSYTGLFTAYEAGWFYLAARYQINVALKWMSKRENMRNDAG